MENNTENQRRNFLKKCGLCAASLTLFNSYDAMASNDTDKIQHLKSARDFFIKRHADMYEILSEALKPKELKIVYQKFGSYCANKFDAVKNTEPYKGNLEKYLEDLPTFDKWQEKAWFDKDKNLVTIIGVKRDKCVCAMARKSGNPNWCHHCCAGHHKEIFEKLLGKKVEVTMGETMLLGGERCNHYVKISNKAV